MQIMDITKVSTSLIAGMGLTLLLGACASQSYQETRAAQIASAEGQECRPITVTGTRFPQLICRSPEGWANVDSNQRNAATEYGRQTSEGSTVIGNPTSLTPASQQGL
jgi:hypothetical protein